jgi:hypothetical protein
MINTALTLGFPEPTEAEKQKAILRAAQELAYEAAASARSIANAAKRKARRTRLRLEALCAGGWIVEFEPRKHLGLQTSTRAELRRAKLGRA